MPKPLSPQQLDALRNSPLGETRNKLRLAFALSEARYADFIAEKRMEQAMVSRIVNGANCMLDTAQKFADFFGCSTDDLFPKRDTSTDAPETEPVANAS